MDQLALNPEALDGTATIIELYCNKQRDTMGAYLSNVMTLSSEWNDDQTMGMLLQEIRQMKQSVESVMDEIRSQYPAYFRQKAEQIRNRPKF